MTNSLIAPQATLHTFSPAQTRMDAVTSRVRHLSGESLDPKKLRQIENSAQDFEAVFLSEMIKPMFEGIEVNEMFGGGRGEEAFKDILIQEYGKKMSAAGGIGLASFIRNELIRQQEGSTAS